MSTLLLVDPDPLTLRVLDVNLRKAGFDVVTASGASEALAKLRGQSPDLLVTATRMPEIDGFALARSLRESAADLPVLFLSGPDEGDAGGRARDVDVDDVLPRPVFVRELVARVNLLLARRGQRAVTSDGARGSTADLALADLLQSLEAAHLTGVVHLEQDGESARVYVREGNVVDAELGRLRGAEVVVRTLSWESATFRVEPGPVDNLDLIECSTHALLLRAMDRIDGRGPAPEAIAPEEEPAPPAPVAREESPSTAPWTREAEPVDTPEPDVLAAGVPRRDGRTLRRVVVAGVTAAAALGVWAALGSIHARTGSAAHVAQAASEPTAVAAEGIPAAPPASPTPAAPLATDAPETTAPDAPADPGVPTSGGQGAPGAVSLAAPSSSIPAGDPREKALDVRTELHARSPLVRDAERALLRGDTGKALALAQQAVDKTPADADGWLTLAAARKNSGDLAGARAAYQQCISKAFTFGVMNCRVLAARSE